MSSSGTTDAGTSGLEPTITPDEPRPLLLTVLTTLPLGLCGTLDPELLPDTWLPVVGGLAVAAVEESVLVAPLLLLGGLLLRPAEAPLLEEPHRLKHNFTFG